MKAAILFLLGAVLLSWVLFLIPVLAAGCSGAPWPGADFFRLAGTFIPTLAHGILMLIGTPAGQKTFFLVFLIACTGFLAGFGKLLLERPKANFGT